jgi:hypothetical protein
MKVATSIYASRSAVPAARLASTRFAMARLWDSA